MPIRLCLEKCANPATYRGRCAVHSRQHNRETHTNRHIYNSARWKHTRNKVLFEQPLCRCGAIAQDVDHVVPLDDGGNPWARHNLQAMCHSCHAAKTNREGRAT